MQGWWRRWPMNVCAFVVHGRPPARPQSPLFPFVSWKNVWYFRRLPSAARLVGSRGLACTPRLLGVKYETLLTVAHSRSHLYLVAVAVVLHDRRHPRDAVAACLRAEHQGSEGCRRRRAVHQQLHDQVREESFLAWGVVWRLDAVDARSRPRFKDTRGFRGGEQRPHGGALSSRFRGRKLFVHSVGPLGSARNDRPYIVAGSFHDYVRVPQERGRPFVLSKLKGSST